MRYYIVDNIITRHLYGIIQKRFNFYYKNPVGTKLPKENIFMSCFRYFFTDEQYIYYFNCRPMKQDDRNFDNFILNLRSAYGYSQRQSSCTFIQLLDSSSDKQPYSFTLRRKLFYSNSYTITRNECNKNITYNFISPQIQQCERRRVKSTKIYPKYNY